MALFNLQEPRAHKVKDSAQFSVEKTGGFFEVTPQITRKAMEI